MTPLSLSIGAVLAAATPAHAPAAAADEPGLLLRDFKPRSMLKVPVHEVERAAFPAVDVHNHVNDARRNDPPVPVADLLAQMDRLNLKRAPGEVYRWARRKARTSCRPSAVSWWPTS